MSRILPGKAANTRNTTAIYALTQQGCMQAERIVKAMGGEIFAPFNLAGEKYVGFERLADLITLNYSQYRQHIIIAALSIAVRCLAPHIAGKAHDPAVVVTDQRGRFVISLLSGHLGGSNKLTLALADLLGGTPVITTATNTESLPTLDTLAIDRGLFIKNLSAVRTVNSTLLKNRKVAVCDPDDHLALRDSPWRELFTFTDSPAILPEQDGFLPPLVQVTTGQEAAGGESRLILHPPVFHVGVCCRKGAHQDDIVSFIEAHFKELGLTTRSIAGIASADTQKDDIALVEVADYYQVPLLLFTAGELSKIKRGSTAPKVAAAQGVEDVCEPAAILSAGPGAQLLTPGQTRNNIAIAVAEALPPKRLEAVQRKLAEMRAARTS